MAANGENTPGPPGNDTPGRVRVNKMIIGQSYIMLMINPKTGRRETAFNRANGGDDGDDYGTLRFTRINDNGEIVDSTGNGYNPMFFIFFEPDTPVNLIHEAIIPINNDSVLNEDELSFIRHAKPVKAPPNPNDYNGNITAFDRNLRQYEEAIAAGAAAGGAGGRPRRGGRRRSTRRSRSRSNRKNRSRKH